MTAADLGEWRLTCFVNLANWILSNCCSRCVTPLEENTFRGKHCWPSFTYISIHAYIRTDTHYWVTLLWLTGEGECHPSHKHSMASFAPSATGHEWLRPCRDLKPWSPNDRANAFCCKSSRSKPGSTQDLNFWKYLHHRAKHSKMNMKLKSEHFLCNYFLCLICTAVLYT